MPGYLSRARHLGGANEALGAQLRALGAGGAGVTGSPGTEAALWDAFGSVGRAASEAASLRVALGDSCALGNELVARCEFAAGVGHQMSSDIGRMVQELIEAGFVREAMHQQLESRAEELNELNRRSQELERSLKLDERGGPGVAPPCGLQVVQGPGGGASLPEALATLRAQYTGVTARFQDEMRDAFSSQFGSPTGLENVAAGQVAGTSGRETESKLMEGSVVQLSAQLQSERSRHQQLSRALEETEGRTRAALEALGARAGTLREEMEGARSGLARQAAARAHVAEARGALREEIAAYRRLVHEAGDGGHSRGIAVSAKCGGALPIARPLPQRSVRVPGTLGVPVGAKGGPPLRAVTANAQNGAHGGDVTRAREEGEEGAGATVRAPLLAGPAKGALGGGKVLSVGPQEVRGEVFQEDDVIWEKGQKVNSEEGQFNGEELQKVSSEDLQKADGEELQKADGEVLQKADGEVLQKADGEVLQKADDEVLQKADGEDLQKADGEDLQKADGEVFQKANDEELQKADDEVLQKADDEELQKADGEDLQKADDEVLQKADDEELQKADGEVLQKADDEELQKADGEMFQKANDEELQKADDEVLQKADDEELQKANGEELQKADGEDLQKADDEELQKADDEELQKADGEDLQKVDDEVLQKADDEDLQKADDEDLQKADDEELQKADDEELQVNSEALQKVASEGPQGQVNSEAPREHQVNGNGPTGVFGEDPQGGSEVSGEQSLEVRGEVDDGHSQAGEATGDGPRDGAEILGEESRVVGEGPLAGNGPAGDARARAGPEPPLAEGPALPGPLQEEEQGEARDDQ
ncbi:uncharacterized protein LOC116954774 isoform X2 [Petromyzon marinus]